MTFAKVRALIIVAVLFITAGVVVIMAIGKDSQTAASTGTACGDGLVPARTKMPERDQVTLNIYNGTGKAGMGDQVAGEFKNRGFNLNKTDGAEPTDAIAVIGYGPDAVGAAWLVNAYFLVDGAKMNFDIKREGAEVDVTIGTRFQQLATTTEVNQSIAALGNPELEEGTCEADE